MWSCVKKNFKMPSFWQIVTDRQKSDSLYDYDTSLDETGENWERSRVFKIVKLETLQRVPNDPKPNSRNRASKAPGIKSSFHMCTIGSKVPNFRPFCSFISRFQDIPHFRFSHLTFMLKFHKVPQNF